MTPAERAAIAADDARLDYEEGGIEKYASSDPVRHRRALLAALAERDARIELLRARLDLAQRRDPQLAALRRLVDQQAEDEGLWFIAQTAPEAYLQQELRKLHATIEGITTREVRTAWGSAPEERTVLAERLLAALRASPAAARAIVAAPHPERERLREAAQEVCAAFGDDAWPDGEDLTTTAVRDAWEDLDLRRDAALSALRAALGGSLPTPEG